MGWRSEPTLPTSVMGKVRALFTVASREPDVEPTALFQRARQVVHFSCSASVGLIVASFLSNKRRCAIFAGAMGGGAIATAAFYGAIFCIFRNFLNFGRREKDILDVLGIPEGLVVWSCVRQPSSDHRSYCAPSTALLPGHHADGRGRHDRHAFCDLQTPPPHGCGSRHRGRLSIYRGRSGVHVEELPQ